jgi:hypothetical protein
VPDEKQLQEIEMFIHFGLKADYAFNNLESCSNLQRSSAIKIEKVSV